MDKTTLCTYLRYRKDDFQWLKTKTIITREKTHQKTVQKIQHLILQMERQQSPLTVRQKVNSLTLIARTKLHYVLLKQGVLLSNRAPILM